MARAAREVPRLPGVDELLRSPAAAPLVERFGRALTLEAIRAELARRGAQAVEELHPALEGDWCALAAGLRCEAGDRVEAGLLYADAGGRALAAGALNSAVTLLSRAESLLADAARLEPCATPDTSALLELLHGRGIRTVSFADFRKIDAVEVERGKRVGKPREKFARVDEMLALLADGGHG